MSPIQTKQQPMGRKHSVSMRRAERYLARARALMRLTETQPMPEEIEARRRRSDLALRAMTYASLASAHAERAVIEHDADERKRRANQKTRAATKKTQNAG